MGSRAWMVVGLLWVIALLNYLDRLMLTTMHDSLMAAIPMSETQFGLLTSVFLWVYGLLSPFAGYLADRYNRSAVILGSLLVWSAVTLLTGLARTFEQLLLARALMGVSEACYIPAALALIADYHRGPTRSLATGIHMTGIAVGSALGGLGGWIAERWGWSVSFLLFGALGIAYALAIGALLRDPPRAGVDGDGGRSGVGFWSGLGSLFSRRDFNLLTLFWSALALAGWALVGWLPTYLIQAFGLPQGKAGLIATISLQSAMLVGLLAGGAWADRWSRTSGRARILVPFLGVCAAAPAVWMAANSGLLPVVVTGVMIYGFGRAFSDANMMPILCLVAEPRYRATGYGVLNMFSCIVGGVGIIAGGILKDRQIELDTLFEMASVSLVVCALALVLVRPHRGDDAPSGGGATVNADGARTAR